MNKTVAQGIPEDQKKQFEDVALGNCDELFLTCVNILQSNHKNDQLSFCSTNKSYHEHNI